MSKITYGTSNCHWFRAFKSNKKTRIVAYIIKENPTNKLKDRGVSNDWRWKRRNLNKYRHARLHLKVNYSLSIWFRAGWCHTRWMWGTCEGGWACGTSPRAHGPPSAYRRARASPWSPRPHNCPRTCTGWVHLTLSCDPIFVFFSIFYCCQLLYWWFYCFNYKVCTL